MININLDKQIYKDLGFDPELEKEKRLRSKIKHSKRIRQVLGVLKHLFIKGMTCFETKDIRKILPINKQYLSDILQDLILFGLIKKHPKKNRLFLLVFCSDQPLFLKYVTKKW